MSQQKPLKEKVSITLDADVVSKIKILSNEDDRNFSQYINMILRKHIESETKNISSK